MQILAPELNDRMLADFLNLDTSVMVNFHVKSLDQAEAINTIKHKLSDIEKTKIEEQKKAVRSGYDMDVLPPDLVTYAGEAKTLLDDLQSRNERMFLVTILVLNIAETKQKLENNVFQTAGIAQKYNCALKRLDFQQEQGLMSSLPIGGKSFSARREIVNAFLITTDDVIITDPEGEYSPLVNRLGGQVVKLSPVSVQYVNPMDINPDYSDEESPLTLKSDFILSLCELIVGGKEGLQPVEKTIIDRCTRLVYRGFLQNPHTEQMPSSKICIIFCASRPSRRHSGLRPRLKSMSRAV